MKKFIGILIFFVIYSFSFSEIKIGVNDDNPSLKQNIIFTVEFINEPKSEYHIEGINNFEVISMGSRSNYSTPNNKQIKYSKSDIYILSPKKDGEINLLVKTKNKTNSNLITLNITKEPENILKEPRLLLETTHYKRDYYYGEKIPFVEKVIIKTSISNYNYISTPAFNGFSIKNITPRDGRGFAIPKRVTVNGKEQIELVLFRSILEPESYGEKTIKTGGISVVGLTEDDKEKEPIYLGFKKFNINILPLPEENKPTNFQEVVGELKGNYKWAKEDIDGKQSFVLKLKLYGSVNLDNLEKVINYNNEDFEIEENTTMFEEHVLDHVYSAEKVFIINFIPKNNKCLTIPKIKIPYFNPIEKKYKEFVINPMQDNLNSCETIKKEKTKVVFSGNIKTDEITNNENLNNTNIIQDKNTNIVSEEKYKSTKIFIIIFLGIISILEGIYIIKLKKHINKK